MRFVKTNQALDGHYHIVYFNDDMKVAALSTDAEHTHEYVWIEPQPAQQDEMGNILQPEVPGGWQMSPGPDGHLHELEEYEKQKVQRRESEEKVVPEVLELLNEAYLLERDSIEKGRESVDFVMGEQWDKTIKSDLESQNRAALTINLVGPKVDELCGYQKQNRQDLRYVPEEGGDQVIADILNHVSKKILEGCYWEREESEVFYNQVVPGRGVINVEVRFDKDMRGEIVAESFPFDQVHFGPHEKLDASDAEYLVKHRMYSAAKIKQMWPDKADEIDVDYGIITSRPSDHVTYQFDQYAHTDNKMPGSPLTMGNMTLVDIAKKEYRVLECWRKVYESIDVLVFPQHDVYESVPDWKPRDIEAARTIPGVVLIRRNSHRMRITKIAGGVLLSDEHPADLPANEFFCFPVYAMRRNGKFQGKVERAKDPQREVNKRHSQSIDIGNRMVAYGWFYDQMTFTDRGLEEFKKNSAVPGFLQEVSDVGRQPAKVEGVKFPSELVQLMNLDREFVDQLMMVNVPPNGANESGAMFSNRQKLALQGSEYLFDHLSFAKKQLGRLLVACIQRYWDAPRIIRLLKNQNQKQQINLAGEPFESYSEADIYDMLENADLTRYDVVVSESTYSPTQRMATLMILRDFAQAGVQIPPELFPEFMDAPEEVKQRILQSIKSQQEAAAAEAGQSQDSEVTKTLIAQGIIPPEVAQQQGIAQPPAQQMPAGQPQQGGGIAEPQPQQPQADPMQGQMDMFAAISEIVNAIKTTPPQLPPITINVDTSKGSSQPDVPMLPL